MSVPVPDRIVAPLASLLAWDAPFLPAVEVGDGTRRGLAVACVAEGRELPAVARWSLRHRMAVALQLVAAALFLFERGWYVSRRLLRAARVRRDDRGVWLQLAGLPRWRLSDPRLERRLSGVGRADEGTLAHVLPSLLAGLLPEKGRQLEAALRDHRPWQAPQELLALLLREARGRVVLAHPGGDGRALWALQLAVPETGVFWVEDESVVGNVAGAARLLAWTQGRQVDIWTGALEEPEVMSVQARAAAAGNDCLVLTTLPLPAVPPLGLATGEDVVWVLAPHPGLGLQHMTLAVERGRFRPFRAAEQLAAGASHAFKLAPEAEPPAREAIRLASSSARKALAWLRAAPIGLEESELEELLGAPCGAALEELQRLRLGELRRQRWRAVEGESDGDAELLQAMATRLPEGAWTRLVAMARTSGDQGPLLLKCEAEVAGGELVLLTEVARLAGMCDEIVLCGAEAALARGVLAEVESLLDGIPAAARDSRWHALAGWWAEQAGLPVRASEELEAVRRRDLPSRLAARVELVAAELARREGTLEKEIVHLERAVRLAGEALPEAALLLAAARGPAALRALRRAQRASWGPDTTARALHLMGFAALGRGAPVVAGTALRAAARVASGENPKLLGDIHSDIGTAAILAEKMAVADRHLILAERMMERCGSRRAVTVVRFNRGVLANDRLSWREAGELVLASRELRGGVVDSSFWLEELELARALLARGDVSEARERLLRAKARLAQHSSHTILQQAAAGVAAHLALANGDVGEAVEASRWAEDSERALIAAIGDAERGMEPRGGLPQRWGLILTARLLAGWLRGEEEAARAEVEGALDRTPREAAVGLARLVAVLSRRGESLGDAWSLLVRRSEAVLEEARLDGWAERLRGTVVHQPVRLLRAVDGLISAGTDALKEERLAELGGAAGLRWVEVFVGGEPVASWGERGETTLEVVSGGVEVRGGGADHGVARATLELLARYLTTQPPLVSTDKPAGTSPILGFSPAMARVRDEIARWAPLPATVLILGEPGTGKELVAHELHRQSQRPGELVVMNCAGIPSTLLEGELFGWVRGAFTDAHRDRTGLVEAAEGGTLFLDEVGELPLELQAKLLRLLQDRAVRRAGSSRSRTVDVRFIAATNRDLGSAVNAGGFRQDLYYRLAVAVIAVPPLRERPEDMDELAQALTAKYAAQYRRPGVVLSPAAIEMLRRGSWAGNVRELESVVIRAVAMASPGEVLGPDRFPDLAAAGEREDLAPWGEALEGFRRSYFGEVLQRCAGNRTRAARRAGISRQALLYHLRKLGLGRSS